MKITLPSRIHQNIRCSTRKMKQETSSVQIQLENILHVIIVITLYHLLLINLSSSNHLIKF